MPAPSTDQLLLYVGCRTSQQRHACGRGIEVFQMRSNRQVQHLQRIEAGINPSFLCLDSEKKALYCVHGDESQASWFSIDTSGRLSARGTVHSGGSNPVHLALSPSGRWLLIANYASGNITTISLLPDGALGTIACTLSLPGTSGPHRHQQRGSHPHQIVFHPSGNWLAVPDKGCDAVHMLTLDEHTGMLTWRSGCDFPSGSGPRHMVFNQQGTLAWVVLELSSQVLAAKVRADDAGLELIQIISTLPDDFCSDNTASGIVLAEETCTLHVSNRGHGSVASYSLNPDIGKLIPVAWTPTGGKMPRFISSIPGTRSLMVANEDTHTLVQLESSVGHQILAQTGSPTCAIFQ